MKVYELAKELKIENKELLKVLSDLDIVATSHMSSITDEQAEIVKDAIASKEDKPSEKEVVKPVQKTVTQWKPDLSRMIAVKNIARGKLIYKSKRTIGYQLEWQKKGDINYIEFSELMYLKNTDRRFVTEPWIRIVEDDEIEILKHMQVFDFYKEILGLNNVSDILKLDFEKFKKKFDKLPEGYKNSVVEFAAEMIASGELDSLKIKNYIEKTMDIDLSILVKSEKKNKSNSVDVE